LAAGQLAEAERAALQSHLAACPACRRTLAALPGGAESIGGQNTTGTETVTAPPRLTTAYRRAEDVPAELAQHPRYEVLQLLGQGGMGTVYKARHKKMDRLVALKVINARLLDNPKAIERFQREAQAAAKLDHPNIVRAYDADEAGDTHFLVMEFVEGIDLAQYVEEMGPLPVTLACHFICQAAQALQHAHERGMVHRDIKPHNLMLVRPRVQPGAGLVKVMDFGMARLTMEGASDSGLTGDNVLMGTLDYVAPEQAEDAHRADIRADIYSLGCTLAHLLAGRSLLAGGSVATKVAAHLSGKLPLGELPATVPAELRMVLAKMTAREPAQRYQTHDEVATVLTPFVKKTRGMKPEPVAKSDERTMNKAAPAAPPDRETKQRRRWPVPVWVGAAIAALLLVVGVIIVMLASRGSQPSEAAPSTNAPSTPETKSAEDLPAAFTNALGMEFVRVPRGKSWLGGGDGTPGEKEVEIAHDFYLGKYEVTQGEWEQVTGLTPSAYKDVAGVQPEDQKRFPVESVSWNDAQDFIQMVNTRTKEQGWVYRLPTEVEWEYACRGGPLSNRLLSGFSFYFAEPTNTLLPRQANFTPEPGKGLQRTCKVGSYPPNRLGLHDMHGNVWEWCADEAPADPKKPRGGLQRVDLGGGWDFDSDWCQAGYRYAYPPSDRYDSLGLRLARVLIGK
jgi:serine/threonine protein kinase